ncbi:hypothetical protein LTR95_010684 [Oleoguttula sp. CCFEE 5521]
MSSSSAYARLREHTLLSLDEEEAVTVNTRALIDKVLARYSGEWTTLRELLQNAADARATEVTIRFETATPTPHPAREPQSPAPPSRDLKHVLHHSTLKTLLVTNNGDPFKETDWQRLKRIAEGNPDETKIGAFGVGFYSVFADCESPFVTSGDQSMAFYWKKDSLFTRRVKAPTGQAGKDTTFVLDYRSSSTPVPSLLSLCQFLATSLTFVGLESIKLYLDDWNVLKLTKKMAPGVEVSVPKDVSPKTKDGLMKITGVEYQNAQIDAQWMNAVGWNRHLPSAPDALPQSQTADNAATSLRGWFSKITGGVNSASAATKRAQKEEELLQLAISEDLAGLSHATVFLRISTVSVQASVSRSLAAELERATKKPPPKHTRIAILTSSYDETSASLTTMSGAGSSKASDIFASVLPTRNGKIFIGFPTAQTTGLLAHISAPSVIPTVERESIDLNARYVRDWNVEMLRVAGIACRIAYTGDMQELSAKIQRQVSVDKRTKVSAADIAAVMPAAIHAFKQYTYEESTPNARVGQYIEEAFWTCNMQAWQASIEVLSTRGILPSQQVRIATEDLSFVDGIPVVPEEIMQKAPDFLAKLRDYGLLSDITTSDIKKELEAQALTEKQVAELLKWACGKVSRQEMDASAVQTLFDGTVAGVDEQFVGLSSSPVIQLGQIRSYVNTSKIPAELPTPPQTMPFRLAKGLSLTQLSSLGWEELQIVPWLRWIIESRGQGFGAGQTIDSTPAVASQVLPVISKAWESLSQSSKQTVVELLVPLTVIPTKSGMRKPPQAYFASVKVFDDLPTIVGLQSVKEKFLFALGVRKTVELNVVFDRLMAKSVGKAADEEAKSSHVDLIKYLVSVKDDIPAEDIKRLRDTPICSAEPRSGDQANKNKLHRLCDLYEPNDAIRRLGLPILHWPGLFRQQSPEGRFLKTLGLRPYPDVPALVDTLNRAPMGSDLQQAALQYFVVNCFHHGYNKYPMATIDKAFLPVLPFPGEKSNLIARPNQCYADPKAAILRFRVLRDDLQSQHAMFGVAMHPPIDIAAERLVKAPPLDISQARTLFGYFAGRLNEIGTSGNLAERLGTTPIVPITSLEKQGSVRFVAPRSVYLGDSANYGDIFDFVDFGAEANTFLLRVGSTHEPSATEIAQLLIKQPGRLLQTLGTEKYLSLLRRVAEHAVVLKKDKAIWAQLRSASCLLAVKEVVKVSPTNDSEKLRDFDDEETTIKEYSLCSAPTMVIVDDFATYRLFQSDLVAAPQEETLEGLYAALETPYLSKLVQDEQRMGQLLRDQSNAQRLEKLIVERCRLFLHDQTEDQIRHDARWLEQNMKVKATEFLQVTRRLKGYRMQFMEKRSAALHRESKRDATLFVTSRCDLYEVSRALMPLLLKRPRQQDYLALEILMESDLGRLKRKGYNVDRILRAKAAETRIAESERVKRDEEQQRNAERGVGTMALSNGVTGQQQQQQQQQQPQLPLTAPPTPPPSQQARIPGAFESPSPESHTQLTRPTPALKPSKSLFGNLTRQLGFNSSQQTTTSSPLPSTEKKVLRDAIAASRPFDSSALATPATTKDLATETPTYCDSTPATDIVRLPCPGLTMGVFVSRSTPSKETFIASHRASIEAFSSLLHTLAQIFALPEASLNIYHEPHGTGIAFNSRQSTFCNLRVFEEQTANGEAGGKVTGYWFVTLCHELAHNLVQEHGQAHSFHTESFVTEYMGELVGGLQ